MTVFNLWVEGYGANEGIFPAQFLGAYEADTFAQAIGKWNAEKNANGEYGHLTHNLTNDTWAAWGCRIFDNEQDARKNYG